MKVFLGLVIFLYTFSSSAQSVRYEDGSYYNDDFIHPGQSVLNPQNIATPHVVNPGQGTVPRVIATESKLGRAPSSRTHKRWKTINTFQEVREGGQAGDFREIGGEPNKPRVRAAK